MKPSSLIILLTSLPVVSFGALNIAGVTPAFIWHGPGVATGIGSKLLCSAEYVMGSKRHQAFDDVVQYSPILGELDISYDETARSVTASLYGFKPRTATYLPGLGCAIDFPEVETRKHVITRQFPTNNAPWPAGSSVATIDLGIQHVLNEMVRADNDAGLNTRALLVVHNGAVVAEQYDQGADANTPLLGWSMAKSFTSVLLGNLELRGLIDLNDKPHFPGWDEDARSAIGIPDLLTMTDGLGFSEEYNPGDDATAMLFTVPSAADYVMAKPLANAPGTVFNYSSGTANLLARLYSDALGSPQAAYDNLMDNVFVPMGFQHAILEMDASGGFVGSSYLYASARDWARMGQMMLNGGTLNDQRIVTEDWITRATTPNSSGNEKAYGYQWWLNAGDAQLRFPNLPPDAYFANGNRQQTVMVIPSRDTVIVRLGWTAGDYPVDKNFSAILEELKAREKLAAGQ